MHRNPSVNVHQFAMVPNPDIPRSSFRMQKALKTTFNAGRLVPVFCEEILPGDTFSVNMTAFARMATPIYPIMDNLYLESFFFFVPNRIVWTNWVKFMGEQASPGDSIAYTVPVSTSPASGYAVGSIQDYFGLPTVGQVNGGSTVTHNVLPLRAFNRIFNDWFRDENLRNPANWRMNHVRLESQLQLRCPNRRTSHRRNHHRRRRRRHRNPKRQRITHRQTPLPQSQRSTTLRTRSERTRTQEKVTQKKVPPTTGGTT